MALGQILEIDPVKSYAVIQFENGRRQSVTFAADANIEVLEPCTMGTMGGTLADLRVGYWVEAAVDDNGAPVCSCSSLRCLS